MAQYDLLLTQNVSAVGIEFSEKYVNLAKGSLLTVGADRSPIALAVGADGYELVADSASPTGFKWQAKASLAQLHDQNTDTGTTSKSFSLQTGGFNVNIDAESATKVGVKVAGGTYADFQGKIISAEKVVISTAPTANSTDAATTSYVDAKVAAGFAANNAMIFKGDITVAAANALTTYNTGWTYRFTDVGTAWGNKVEIGDQMTAVTTRAGVGAVATDWSFVQVNTDGIVIGPTAATDSAIALFNGAGGKLIKDSAKTIATTLGATDATLPTSKAVKDVTDLLIPKNAFTATGNEVLVGSAASTYAPITSGVSTIFGRKATGNVGPMTGGEAAVVIGIGTGAEVNTGTDNLKIVTAKAIADSRIVKGPATATVADRIATFVDTTGKAIKDSGKTLADFMVNWVAAPTTMTSAGTIGNVAKDGNFLYICTAANVWKRSPIATNW